MDFCITCKNKKTDLRHDSQVNYRAWTCQKYSKLQDFYEFVPRNDKTGVSVINLIANYSKKKLPNNVDSDSIDHINKLKWRILLTTLVGQDRHCCSHISFITYSRTINSSVDEIRERYRLNHAIAIRAACQAVVCGTTCL